MQINLARREWCRKERLLPNPKLKFLEQCREAMQFKQLSYQTQEAYLQWIRRFII